jgi:NAD-dependent deacetylase
VNDDLLTAAADLLREATSVVVLTGAGVSAESGVSTFRDAEDGLWAKYDPMQLATIEAFHADPELVTRWYHHRFEKCRHCEPNPGHHALADMQLRYTQRGHRFTLLTQNIDGLHQRAGSTDVVEFHGTILTWRCMDTGEHYPMAEIDFSSFPPMSPAGGLLRPNVVWFGEMLPTDALATADEVVSACDLFISVGTSAVVYPAAGYIEIARARGAKTIEINRDHTPMSGRVDLSIRGLSGEVLPQLVERAFA